MQFLVPCEVLDSRSTTIPALSLWRPQSSSRPRAPSITSTAPMDASRPITAVRAAGYSSQVGLLSLSYLCAVSTMFECRKLRSMQRSRFDPLNQGVKALATECSRKEDINLELQGREAEKAVNHLLQKSAAANWKVNMFCTGCFVN